EPTMIPTTTASPSTIRNLRASRVTGAVNTKRTRDTHPLRPPFDSCSASSHARYRGALGGPRRPARSGAQWVLSLRAGPARWLLTRHDDLANRAIEIGVAPK